ncbi:MAG: DUF4405 domain-containing protein [Chloracidobacterium sp.]|nr:DUF4405 domain-containing protein [Chloracidobacterium sp.]
MAQSPGHPKSRLPGDVSRRPAKDRSHTVVVYLWQCLFTSSLSTHSSLEPALERRWASGNCDDRGIFITLITGILLMFYYKPYPDVAYQSIKDIHFIVPTGRFMRNIHRWAANVMVIAVILHMARAFYTASYRKPRI